MSITPFEMYVILMLDNITGSLSALCFVSFILVVFLFFALIVVEREDRKFTRTLLIGSALFSIVCLSVRTFTPTTKQAAVIMVAPAIINNAEVQKLPANLVNLANDWIDEMKPEIKDTKHGN